MEGSRITSRRRLLHRSLPALLAIALVACGGEDPAPAPDPSPPTPSGTSSTIPATAVETVTGDDGASVEIPAHFDTEVTVEAVTTLDGLHPTGDPEAFLGGIALEPHGLTFDSPVSITIPLTRPETPGRELQLFYWDDENEGWEETDFTATVAENGLTASGEVTHFSYYVLQPSTLGAELQGVFGDIHGAVRGVTRAGGDESAATLAVFNEVVAHVNARFPLLESRPLSVPIPNGDNCYAPVGIFFVFYHGGVDGDTQPLVATIGNIEDDAVEFRIDYFRTIDVYAKAGEVENQVAGFFAVNIYWHSFPPELAVTARDDLLWPGDSTDITADLVCGDLGMRGQEIDLSVEARSPDISLDPHNGVTDQTGRMRARLDTTDDAYGKAVVTGTYEWTNQTGDVTTEVVDTAQIAVRGITGTWTITGSETWTGCEEETDNGTYAGTGSFDVVQTGETTFQGGADFPRESDRFDGTITWHGDEGFTVSGTSRYREEYLICGDDGCTTWIVSGTLGFEGTGSIESNSIDFTWRGQDLRGDTCSFRGRGRATRESG